MFLLTRKSIQQVAVLPFVPIGRDFEVLLITSRHGGHWIVPKGWPSAKQSLAEAAAREAQEEAGLVGVIHAEPIGSFSYRKKMDAGYGVRCHVHVFPFLVMQQCVSWLEQGERSLRWCSLGDAVRLVEDRGLAELLAGLNADDAVALHETLDTLSALSTESLSTTV